MSAEDGDDGIVWRQIRDEASGEFYFHNLRTDETVWERPSHFPYATPYDPNDDEPEPAAEAAPKPVKWTKVAGTDWQRVETDTGEEYFFNAMTNVTSWEVPEELAAIPAHVLRAPAPPRPTPAQVQQQMQTHMQAQMQAHMQAQIQAQMQAQMHMQAQMQAQMTGKRPGSAAGMQQPPAKVMRSVEEEARARGMSAEDVAFERRLRMLRGEAPPDAEEEERKEREAEERKEKEEKERRERAEQEKMFFELLAEHKVTQFTMWDAVETKLAKDERFSALPTQSARKEAFERYARERAGKRRQEKVTAAKALAGLVREAVAAGVLEASAFKKEYGSDERYNVAGALSAKEVEEMFEKEAKPVREQRLKEKKLDRAEGRQMYVGLLQECSWIRYDSHWSDVRRRLRRDSARYSKCGLSSDEKEDLFYEHVDRLKKTRDRERKLRQLEEEARRRREREARDLEYRKRVRERKEAVEGLQCLYEEMVKRHFSWEEAEERLGAMPRFNTRAISEREKRELLAEHLEKLGLGQRRQFLSLLESMPGVTVDSTVEGVTASLATVDDSRAGLLDEAGRREAIETHLRRLVADAARHFRRLLEEDVAKITPARSGPSFDKALRLMRKDKRWKALDSHADVRDQLIIEYMEGGAAPGSDEEE